MSRAEQAGLDLVEIAPTADPPVCKIIDYGKLRYQLTKKEKENKKAQHQVKVKEVKLKPNTDEHDVTTKLKHAREFALKGNKVRITCVFRGREMLHTEYGMKIVYKMCEDLSDVATPESPPKMLGRALSVVLTPGGKKKIEKGTERREKSRDQSQNENLQVSDQKIQSDRNGQTHSEKPGSQSPTSSQEL